ncbi:DUF2306 domain-containing protein [Pelagibius sp. Alg239-R121]|uniref:DUF2306 domain-containing protein n=1 Tax=Pelagibius sp. Alg239-R121 TaxID=2993448 RepID=UPI0024A6DBF8|nr:DUF2306 domain-containing protein [Pelagibius sp. Alg239-R121]
MFNLDPLLQANTAIQIHASAAIVAFCLGVLQFAAPKGTLPHRTIGWIWVVVMMFVAGSSLWVHEIRLIGPWSPIHLISLWVLAGLPFAVIAARQHRVDSHRRAMIGFFTGGLLLAGALTFLPGRLMPKVFFGL